MPKSSGTISATRVAAAHGCARRRPRVERPRRSARLPLAVHGACAASTCTGMQGCNRPSHRSLFLFLALNVSAVYHRGSLCHGGSRARTVCGRDAAVEPTGMYSRRVPQHAWPTSRPRRGGTTRLAKRVSLSGNRTRGGKYVPASSGGTRSAVQSCIAGRAGAGHPRPDRSPRCESPLRRTALFAVSGQQGRSEALVVPHTQVARRAMRGAGPSAAGMPQSSLQGRIHGVSRTTHGPPCDRATKHRSRISRPAARSPPRSRCPG